MWSESISKQPTRARFLFGVVLLSMILTFLILIPYPREDGHLISSDGAFYYSYLRSLVLDGDVDLVNDIALYNSRMPVDYEHRLGMNAAYVFSVGPAILNAPFFLTARLLVTIIHSAGGEIPTDGYSWIEEAAFCLGNVLYAMIGLYLLFLVLQKFYSVRAALYAVMFSIYGTSVVAYLYLETWMSHAPELFGIGVFLYLLHQSKSRPRHAFLIGAALGIAFLIRWQNALWGVMLIIPIHEYLRKNHAGQALLFSSLAAAGFLVLAIPQFLFWKVTSGAWITVPQGDQFIGFEHFGIPGVLFSSRSGLLIWTPVTAFAIYGWMRMRHGMHAIVFGSLLVLQLIAVGFVLDWWAGNAFGARRLVGMVPAFSFGLAALIERSFHAKYHRIMVSVLSICTVWTLLFFLQYGLNLIPRDTYLSFDQVVVQKIRLPLIVLEKIL